VLQSFSPSVAITSVAVDSVSLSVIGVEYTPRAVSTTVEDQASRCGLVWTVVNTRMTTEAGLGSAITACHGKRCSTQQTVTGYDVASKRH
jgi:hypothetical protein